MNFSKPHKYKVASKERRTADGITFDSMAEMNRYMELKALEKSGAITNLGLQPKFLLIPKMEKGGRAVYYTAGLKYRMNGKTVYEDVKGVLTEVYKLKKSYYFGNILIFGLSSIRCKKIKTA